MENTWKDNYEYLDFYKERYKFMSSFLNFEKIESIMDLGAGPEFLREFIPVKCKYYPVDYLKKTENTIIRDFNKGEFFEEKVDVIFAEGLLEYIYNLPDFIKKINKYTNCIIATYRFPELYPELNRDILVNHYSQKELFNIFKKAGFKLTLKPIYNKDFTVFIFTKNNCSFVNKKRIFRFNHRNLFSIENKLSNNLKKQKTLTFLGVKITWKV